MITSIISWVLSPFGKVMLVVLAFLAWTAFQREQAAVHARAQCHAEQLQKTIDELHRQNAAAEAAKIAAEQQSAQTEQEMAALEHEKNDLIQKLADGPCTIPKDATDGLGKIR